MGYVLPSAIAALVTLVLSPLVIKLAIKFGVVDHPGERKVHKSIMPLMGGLAVYVGFWAAMLLTQPLTTEIIAFGLGSLLILISGIWDDSRELKPLGKLIFQIAATMIVVFYGNVRITFVTNLFGVNPQELGWLSLPLTFAWIIGLTNAVNLMDGLDGLAAGISGIAAITVGVVAWLEGLVAVSVPAVILGVSSLAFLRSNFHPAKIFLGDTGALFLGYSVAVLSILSLTKVTTAVSLFLPILILGVPIFDTILAIVRRLINKKPIYLPDKDHLHHRLLAMGLSHKNAVLVVYGVCLFLSVAATGISRLPTGQAMMAIFLVTLVVLYSADKIGIIGRKVREKRSDSETSAATLERRR